MESIDVDEKTLQGLQAAVAATEYLCEITTALGLDPTKADVEKILARIKELLQMEQEQKEAADALKAGAGTGKGGAF